MASRFKQSRNRRAISVALLGIPLAVAALPSRLRAQGEEHGSVKKPTASRVGIWKLKLTGGPQVGREGSSFSFNPWFAGDVSDVGLPFLAVRVTGQTAQGEKLVRQGRPDRQGMYRVELPLGAYTAIARTEGAASTSNSIDIHVVGLELGVPERLAENRFRLRALRRGGRTTGREDVYIFAKLEGSEAKRYEGTSGAPLALTFDRAGDYAVWASMSYRGLPLSSSSHSITITLPAPEPLVPVAPPRPVDRGVETTAPRLDTAPRKSGVPWGALLVASLAVGALGLAIWRVLVRRARNAAALEPGPAPQPSTVSCRLIGGCPTLKASVPQLGTVTLIVKNRTGTTWIARQQGKERQDGTAHLHS